MEIDEYPPRLNNRHQGYFHTIREKVIHITKYKHVTLKGMVAFSKYLMILYTVQKVKICNKACQC